MADEVREQAARHYNEHELGALVLAIGLVNLWNRVKVSTRQVPGGLKLNDFRSMRSRVRRPRRCSPPRVHEKPTGPAARRACWTGLPASAPRPARRCGN